MSEAAPPPRGATCTLPGHAAPLSFDSVAAYEAHYLNEHAFRCSALQPPPPSAATTLAARRRAAESSPRCGKTFPSAHLLALHADECHSPLTLERQARGEKTVGRCLTQLACFEPSCTRVFAAPKLRRQHLVAVHHYPPEYFFSVTQHGIGRLRALYGDGASLVRKAWTPRSVHDLERKEPPPQGGCLAEARPEESTTAVYPSPGSSPAPHPSAEPVSTTAVSAAVGPPRKRDRDSPERSPSPPPMDAVLESLSVLSLVPRTVSRAK